MGRLRVSNQFDSSPRFNSDPDRTIFASRVRGVQLSLRSRHSIIYANCLCRFPASAELRTHAGKKWINATVIRGAFKYLFFKIQAFGVFGLCQLHAFADYIRSRLSAEQFDILFRSVLMAAGGIALAAMGILTITGTVFI